MTYEYKGYKPPKKGWRVSKQVMEELDANGRLIFPPTLDGRIREKNYLDEQEWPTVADVWTDIPPLQSGNRLGYPTEKPLPLLERIIEASSREGDVVLDPFCGCGTSVVASHRLGRQWIGIDVTFIAIDLIRGRLEDSYGTAVSFQIDGIPKDMGGAQALFNANPFDFERWAVSMVYGQPNQKQVGDKGIDGVIRFPLASKGAVGEALISVKGGKQINPSMVRDLVGTVKTRNAEMGVLITLAKPTKGMMDAANHAGTYEWPVNGQTYPKIQIVTVQELLDGKRIDMPPSLTPYIQATRQQAATQQMKLGGKGA